VTLGHSQQELAAIEGITQGAVSQALHRSGALAVEAAHARLGELTP
jgi:predicted transcriptional regulator